MNSLEFDEKKLDAGGLNDCGTKMTTEGRDPSDPDVTKCDKM